MNTFRLCTFTTSDDDEEYQGYTDGATYNKWDNIILTREQLVDFLAPIDVSFHEPHTVLNDRDYPIALIYGWNGDNLIESSPFVDDTGAIREGYYLDGEYMVKDDENEVDLIASGYDWICPHCDHWNHIIEVLEQVTCEECKKTYTVKGYNHALP